MLKQKKNINKTQIRDPSDPLRTNLVLSINKSLYVVTKFFRLMSIVDSMLSLNSVRHFLKPKTLLLFVQFNKWASSILWTAIWLWQQRLEFCSFWTQTSFHELVSEKENNFFRSRFFFYLFIYLFGKYFSNVSIFFSFLS